MVDLFLFLSPLSLLSTKKSRNQNKREAKLAVKWGMDLATFTAPRIKQILKLASLDGDVFEALVLVKRMGTDVREGRRAQFNYIGRLLREVEPDLMDALIQAMKDGDHSKLQTISNTDWIMEDDDEELDDAESEAEECSVLGGCMVTPSCKGQSDYIDTASRWFEGLINKDVGITKEVYSIHSVEFDRQLHESLAPRAADPNNDWHDYKLNHARCKVSQIQFLQGFRNQMLDAIKDVSKFNKNVLFINSCFAHCQSERQDTWFADDSPMIEDKSVALSVGDWFFDRVGVSAIDCPYPYDNTCHNLVFK